MLTLPNPEHADQILDGHDDRRVLLELGDVGEDRARRIYDAVSSHLSPACLDRSCPNF